MCASSEGFDFSKETLVLLFGVAVDNLHSNVLSVPDAPIHAPKATLHSHIYSEDHTCKWLNDTQEAIKYVSQLIRKHTANLGVVSKILQKLP